jgi:hypothetical protein
VIAGAIALAVAAWAVTFGAPWGNFWIKIGVAVIVINAYAAVWQRPALRFSVRSVLHGLASAALLYAVFLAGHASAPYVISAADSQVGRIYGLGEGTPKVWIALLLLLVTGPGEEIFWRGFLQEHLQRRLGAVPGFVTAGLVYGGVHVFSRNPMLILAALTAGLFWGGFYLWKKDLPALIVSHAVWSALIFAVAPIGA